MNIVLLCIALKYDEVETDSIVAKLIIMYSSIAVGVVQLLKAAFYIGRYYIHIRTEYVWLNHKRCRAAV